MHKIGETLFDGMYLLALIVMAELLFLGSREESFLYGFMTLVLLAGDACHLLPRVYALWQPRWDGASWWLGMGKLATSVTMTVFYILLYKVYFLSNDTRAPVLLTAVVIGLGLVRLVLCLSPENQWERGSASLRWRLYRNAPFVALGMIVFYLYTGVPEGSPYSYMSRAVFLSFLFYLPVALGAGKYPILGSLMLPKTCVYLWIISMGF